MDWTRERVARLGRPFRVWLAIRRVALNPRSIVRLPVELGRALIEPLEPIRIPPRPVAPEHVRDEARAAVRAATLERWLHPEPLRPLAGLRVAIIADRPLIDGLAPECHLVELRPDRWRSQMEVERPDLLLVSSARDGNGGSWRYRVATHAYRPSIGLPDLAALTAWCTANGVPTVFWNVDDPVQTDRFAEAAAMFDWIFTVDPGSVDAYLALPLRRAAAVDVLRPAVQPRVALMRVQTEAPTPSALMIGAGAPSWRLDRRDALLRLATAAAGVQLTVLDPWLGTVPRTDLPEAIRSARRAGSPATHRPEVLVRHAVALVPSASVDVLPFAALEALACGTPVVMTSHREVAPLADVLVSDNDAAALRAAVDRFATDPAASAAARTDGLRRAVRGGTYRDRLAHIARTVGLTAATPPIGISMAVLLSGTGAVEHAVSVVATQERQPEEVIVGAEDWADGRTLQERLARACPGLPVRVVEVRVDLGRPAAAARIAAAAVSPWLLPLTVADPVDTGLVDRAAAALMAGLPSPTALVGRTAVLGGIGLWTEGVGPEHPA